MRFPALFPDPDPLNILMEAFNRHASLSSASKQFEVHPSKNEGLVIFYIKSLSLC